ncbi:NAD(P)-binding protein [Ferdinandcohnia sp. Marseille-Q9671]
MELTPLMVQLAGKNVVIVGGGRIAERRIQKLLGSGANLHVISPTLTDGLRSLCGKGLFIWQNKHFEPEDSKEAFLVIVATNDSMVNKTVVQSCASNTLVNMASEASEGNVQFPAHFKQGRLSISIATNGASPLLSGKIKRQLQIMYDKNYGEYVDFLYECRQLIKHSMFDEYEQKCILKDLLSDDYQNKMKQELALNLLKSYSREGWTNERIGG